MDASADTDTDTDTDSAETQRGCPLDAPPKLFGLYDLQSCNESGDVLFYNDAVGWGIEFADRTITLMRGFDDDWSFGIHKSPRDAAALFSFVHPVRISYV